MFNDKQYKFEPSKSLERNIQKLRTKQEECITRSADLEKGKLAIILREKLHE